MGSSPFGTLANPYSTGPAGRKYPCEVVSERITQTIVWPDGRSDTYHECVVRTSRETMIKMINDDRETFGFISLTQGVCPKLWFVS